MQVFISEGNSKMGVVPSVSLPPGISCPKGVKCRKMCYAARNLKLRKTWGKTLQNNWKVWQDDPTTYHASIRRWLCYRKPRMFRWHVAGDIPTWTYYMSMRAIASMFPRVKFLCFTKNVAVLESAPLPPKNLSVVVSRWPGDKEPSAFVSENFAQAWVSIDERKPSLGKMVKACEGRCDTCAKCWKLKPFQHVILKKH